MNLPKPSVALFFCLSALPLKAHEDKATPLRDLRHLTGAQTSSFAYEVTRLESPIQGYGIVLKSGSNYQVHGDIQGPCAVYVSMVTPSPSLKAKWGKSNFVVPENRRFYFNAGKALLPLATLDEHGKLYGRNPAKEGELVTQELFVAVGDFKDGPLTLSTDHGEARITRIRFRPLTNDEYALATHQNAPSQNRTVIHNNDGFSHGFGDPNWDRRALLQQINIYADSDVGQVDWAPLVSGVVSYPSKYADWLGDGVTEWAREFERIASENYRNLEKDGTPLYPTLVQRGKELGIEIWGSLRMSAYYGKHVYGRAFNGKLWHENPQFVIKDKDGNETQGWRMSYAYKPVQEQRIGVLTELAEMGCQGVNLDFCRYPTVLGYDAPLLEGFEAKYSEDPRTLDNYDARWIAYRCDFFNDFMRDVRKRLDAVAMKRRKQVKISVRIPAANGRDYGFDPETWVKEGLIDLLIIGWPSVDKPYDLKPWKKLVTGTKVQLYGHIESFIHRGKLHELTDAQVKQGLKADPDTAYQAEDYLRRAAVLYAEGADGIYLFNNFGSKPPTTRNLLGDKQSVRRWAEFIDPLKLHAETIKLSDSL